MAVIWCNGEWNGGPLAVPATDRGFAQGLGLFETMLAVHGRLVWPDRHLARLHASCARLGWPAPPLDAAALAALAAELVGRNRLADGLARVRLGLTAGSGGLADLTQGADRLLWLGAAAVPAAAAAMAADISPWPRNERSPLAGLKCESYAENLLALDHARRRGFTETIFLNTAGQLCEAATANVFLARDGRLATPPLASGCLPGIGRDLVIGLAASAGIPCAEQPLEPAELERADEIMLTSAIRGPVALARIAGRALPAPTLAPLLRDLWQRAAGIGGAAADPGDPAPPGG